MQQDVSHENEPFDLYDLDPRITIKVSDHTAHTEVCSTGVSCCPTACQ